MHDCTATGANDCLLIAVGTADFRDAIAECVAISGNPAMEFPCLKMLVEAVTWTPPPPPQPPQRIIVQPARTPRPYVVLPGTVTMPIQRGAMPGTYYVQTPNGPRWFSVKPLP